MAMGSWRVAPGLLPEIELVATAGKESLSHPLSAVLGGARGGLVADLATPAGQPCELFSGVHLDPARVARLGRRRLLCEPLSEFAVAPHARQQCGDELCEVAQRGGAQQEVRVCAGRRLRLLRFELRE